MSEPRSNNSSPFNTGPRGKGLRRRNHRDQRDSIVTLNSELEEADLKMSTKYKGMTMTAGRHKLHVLWSPVFIAVWFLLYFLATILLHKLPTPLPDDDTNPGKFIAEKAEKNLLELTNIGPRVTGSAANEQAAMQFLINQVDKISKSISDDYVIETSTQTASGGYVLFSMINTYQSIQNFVVKLSPKTLRSNSSLLINSHFDSVPGSPGAGDDGLMVVVMLEVLRVLSQSPPNSIRHSIIFLFNGAEENPLQASHAFITQHQWAKEVKAFINLDSAGNGGKEVLFQSGPNHPWLMKYYRDSVLHPFAATPAEELFQSGMVPSDTDFRVFRDYGRIPGLDLAHSYNGYVYHTKYDRFNTIPSGTYQHTGDNVLELAKALANAVEMDNPEEYAEGHTVYYDFLGLFMVFYTEKQGTIANLSVALIALIVIGISLWCMARNSGLGFCNVLASFGISILVQILAIIVGFTIPLLLTLIFDWAGKTLSWFSQPWLIIGIYVCPLLFALGIIPALYFTFTRDSSLLLCHRIQLILHSHCVYLIIILCLCAAFNIRSAFLVMISAFFYTGTLCINLVTTFHNKPFLWLIPHLIGQVIPFMFYSYQVHSSLTSFIPMAGRSGPSSNPELIICALSLVFGLLMVGFLVPILCIFRQAKMIISGILVVAVIFVILAFTPIGFPFRAHSTPQRQWIMHTKRTFNDYDGSVRKIDSGFLILPYDRLSIEPVKEHVINMSLVQSTNNDCPHELHCGLPTYTGRVLAILDKSYWIPADPPDLFSAPNLRLIKKDTFSSRLTRFTFALRGPDHMSIIISPVSNEIELMNWSFPVRFDKRNFLPPYFIYFSYGIDSSPLEFTLDFKVPENWKNQTVGIAVAGHWTHHSIRYTDKFNEFIYSFPDWAYVQPWISSYESWEF